MNITLTDAEKTLIEESLDHMRNALGIAPQIAGQIKALVLNSGGQLSEQDEALMVDGITQAEAQVAAKRRAITILMAKFYEID